VGSARGRTLLGLGCKAVEILPQQYTHNSRGHRVPLIHPADGWKPDPRCLRLPGWDSFVSSSSLPLWDATEPLSSSAKRSPLRCPNENGEPRDPPPVVMFFGCTTQPCQARAAFRGEWYCDQRFRAQEWRSRECRPDQARPNRSRCHATVHRRQRCHRSRLWTLSRLRQRSGPRRNGHTLRQRHSGGRR